MEQTETHTNYLWQNGVHGKNGCQWPCILGTNYSVSLSLAVLGLPKNTCLSPNVSCVLLSLPMSLFWSLNWGWHVPHLSLFILYSCSVYLFHCTSTANWFSLSSSQERDCSPILPFRSALRLSSLGWGAHPLFPLLWLKERGIS